nr:hypothetical protein BaRGS_013169 [Batillaria attramentaria]
MWERKVFGSYYVVHGVLQERATEILIFSIATFAVLIYLIVNYAAGKKDSVKLYYRSGNLIFRMVGANAQLQFMCRLLFLFFDCLKFDLQLGISMVILILVSRLNVDTEDIVVLSVGGTVTIAWFFLGYYTVADYINTYSGVAGSTIACGILALSVRVIVMIVSVFVVRNFNKGLKEKGKS